MLPLATGAQMRLADRRLSTELGVASLVLMENAGRGAVEALERYLGTAGGQRVVVVCGRGNNGGDGFVVVRHLLARGAAVEVWLVGRGAEISGDAAVNLDVLRRAGLRVSELTPEAADTAMATLERSLAGAAVIVDALLGTGLRGPATGLAAEAILAINRAGAPVCALDLPSGMSADGVELGGPVVRAALTVSFGLAKVGLFSGPGVRAAGRVTVVDLGVPRAWVDREVGAGLVEAGDVCAVLPSRSADAHKGHYGHLLVVAGSEGKTGAAALAGRAALRVGTGLVTCAIPASQRALVAGNLPELMTEPLAETAVRTVAGGGATQVLKLADRMAGLALGPGLGLDPETQGVVRELVATVACPLVVDADALTAVATDLGVVRRARGPRILTPHPGEAARLLGCAAAEVQADRIGASRRLAEASGGVVVLKGAGTVVAAPEGSISINPTGNPGMATGGMGDVLTGAVAGLLAQGLAPLWAARAAVYLHGLAGDLAAARHGAAGLLASDVADLLPEAMQQVRSQRP